MHVNTILVTGGAGSIGTSLISKLVDKCDKLIVLDNFSSSLSNDLVNSSKIELVSGDICNDEVLEHIFSNKINHVYHLAANFANQNSVNYPEKDLMTNGMGTLKLLKFCVQNNVEKFLLSSSSCVYRPTDVPFAEDSPLALTTPYAITKLLSEHYVSFYNKFYKLPAVIVRYFNSYGPYTRPGKFRGVVPNFLSQAMKGEPITITGTGDETRPFTYVEDIVDGTILAMENGCGDTYAYSAHPPHSDESLVYNIGNERSVKIKYLAELINETCGNKSEIKYLPKRDWDVIPNRSVNASRAKEKFGFETKHSLEDGIKKTYEWYKENGVV